MLIGITFITLNVFCQSRNNYPSLYNDDGVLLYDSTYKLSNIDNVPLLFNGERGLHYMVLTKVNYPKEAIDNGIYGSIILKLKMVVKDGRYLYLTEIKSISDTLPILTKSVIAQVKKIFTNEYHFFRKEEEIKSYELLIPFEFNRITAEKENINIIKNYFSEEKKCFLFTVEISSFNSH